MRLKVSFERKDSLKCNQFFDVAKNIPMKIILIGKGLQFILNKRFFYMCKPDR